MEELVHNQILGFKKLHLKDRKIDNIILMGDSFMDKLFEDKQSMKENRTVSYDAFMEEYQWVVSHSPEEISVSLDVSLEYAEILIPAYDYIPGICGGTGGSDYVAAGTS